MDYRAHVDSVAQNTALIVEALRVGPLDARVPTCPAWTMTDLARHVGEFSGFWTHVVCDGSGGPRTPFSDWPPAGPVADWCEEVFGHLVEQLRATPPETPAWTWVPADQSVGFIGRRCAHELAVHRVDAQLARGDAQPIDAALAADGIEEIFVMMANWPIPEDSGRGETIHLHATDGGGEWVLTLNGDGVHVDRHHAKGDLALRGAVADLELVLYQRPPVGPVEHLGDDAALAGWYRCFSFG